MYLCGRDMKTNDIQQADTPRAQEYFHLMPQNWNCAQSILKAHQSLGNLTDQEIELQYRPKGGGRAEGGLCGAIYAVRDVLRQSGRDADGAVEAFGAELGGTTCAELRGRCGRTCGQIVDTADRLLRQYLSEMNYKVIALDVDGTLVRHSGALSEAVRESLLTAQRTHGLRVVIASGRPTPGLKALADELQLARYRGYLMPFNGGAIYSASDLEHPVYSATLPEELIPELYEMTREAGVRIVTYSDTHLLSEDIANEHVQREVGITGMPTRELESFVREVPRALNKCLAVGDADRIEALEPIARARLAGRVDAFRSSPYFLELVPVGVNKGRALSRLLEELSLEPSTLIAVGDNYNDMEMVRLAGLGVAMANAVPELKASADYITQSNEEDGVATLLAHLGLS